VVCKPYQGKRDEGRKIDGEMKIVINTNYDAPGTKVCVDDLIPRLQSAGHEVTRNDWQNYKEYDLALFMSPDSAVDKARQVNPAIVCGIMDPKIDTKILRNNTRAADFILVSSVEQREALSVYNKNIVIYYMFPQMKEAFKKHQPSEPIKIGFHGNIEHLDAFKPTIARALDRLAEEIDVELRVVYNIKKFGEWKMGVPTKMKVKHIQWQKETFNEELANCDIGIANNVIYQPKITLVIDWIIYYLRRYGVRVNLPVNPNDFLVRYKYSANPGRLYVFSQLGVPVVSDFVPSANQFIRDGESGFIANTETGWYVALKKLAESSELRQSMSDELRKFINNHYSTDLNFERLNKWFIGEVQKKQSKN